jgi:hypothetical protein
MKFSKTVGNSWHHVLDRPDDLQPRVPSETVHEWHGREELHTPAATPAAATATATGTIVLFPIRRLINIKRKRLNNVTNTNPSHSASRKLVLG